MAGKSLDWSRRSVEDRARIADFYIAEASAFIAQEADSAIVAAAGRILKFPQGYRTGLRGTREYIMRRFPFILVYRTTPTGVQIVRVLHQARQYFNR